MALLGAVALILLINPVGFIGGPRDDGQYLAAARCWAEHGACLPTTHWQGRWPVFAPIALLIKLFGESRTVVGIWPLICGFAALLLLARAGERLFDLRTGIRAALLLAVTPAFAFQLLRPNVETVELALIIAALLCAMAWRDGRLGRWAFAAGLLFGLAFQVRETSLVAAVLTAAVLLWLGPRPRAAAIGWAVLGFALPLGIEFLTYYLATGDLFHRRSLSLSHGQISSSELPTAGERAGSPILNPDYIANWRRSLGIHVHWLVDGPLNLLLNARAGLSLLLGPILLLAARAWIAPPARRAGWLLLGLAAAYVLILIFVLAIDPKPRIMLAPLALGSLALAVMLVSFVDHRRQAVAAVTFTAAALAGMAVLATTVRMGRADDQAGSWLARYPGAIETNPMTRSVLTLNPHVRALPDLGAGRPYAMIMSNFDCGRWIPRSGLEPGLLTLVGQRSLRVSLARNVAVPSLCLFRYERPIPAARMKRALDRAWGNRSTLDES